MVTRSVFVLMFRFHFPSSLISPSAEGAAAMAVASTAGTGAADVAVEMRRCGQGVVGGFECRRRWF